MYNGGDNIAKELIQIQERLNSERSTFENHWQEIAPLVLGRQDDFFNSQSQQGEKRNERRFDDTAALALERFAAAKEQVRTPRGQKWHRIAPEDEELLDDKEVALWCENYNDFLFKMRNRPQSNYAKQQHECYMSDGAFGTSVLIVEDMVGYGARYKSSHISEHFFMENRYGVIDVDYRKYKLSARQALQRFGEKLPDKIKDKVKTNPYEMFEFLHVVVPDEDNESKGRFRFKSFDVCIESAKLLDNGGYKSFPYIIDRHLTAPNETYGRSPAMQVLSEIKMLNAIRKTDLRARHLAVDPPILAADQETVRRFSMKPNAINYGTLDAAGNPLVRPYQSGARIDVSNDALQQSRQFINDSFYVTLFQILVDAPAMTATEVLQRAQEKGALLAPVMTHDSLGYMIERETSIYEEYGIFEDGMPLALPRKLKERGGAFSVEYTSPLARAAKMEEGVATERTVQALLLLAQIDPSILGGVNWMEYAEIMREANGAPSRLFKSKEQMEAEKQAEQQAMAMQQMVQAAPQVAGAVKDIAQAQSYMQ